MFVSVDQQRVTVGERVSVSCNVTGHPQPELHWLNKQNGQTLVGIHSETYSCKSRISCNKINALPLCCYFIIWCMLI